jgi:integrase
MLTTAFDRKKLKSVPKMPHRKEYKGRIRFLSPEEENSVLALANQWDKLDEADAVAVFLDTGLRASELTYIEPRDINHSNKQNSVTVWENKGDEPRSIPLTVRAYSILRRRAITHKVKLFPYDKDWTRSFWDRAKASMGLTDDNQFVIHALRHTFASRLVQRGVPLVAVKNLMGHKDIKTTMRYAHLAPNNFPDAIAVLEPPQATLANA